MLATGILYSHSEHVTALRDQLAVAPMPQSDATALREESHGKTPASRQAADGAKVRLSAPSKASALYAWFATGLLDDPLRLSDLEVEAIRLLASGGSTQEIGKHLLGHATAASNRNHVAALLRMARGKLSANSNTHLIRLAYRYRLIEPVQGNPPLPPWCP